MMHMKSIDNCFKNFILSKDRGIEMEENMSKIKKLLEKIHINLYKFNHENEELEERSFLGVINDLAESWEFIDDDYKDKWYEAMGIVPYANSQFVIKPKTINPKDFDCFKDTGIEYLQNQPTC